MDADDYYYFLVTTLLFFVTTSYLLTFISYAVFVIFVVGAVHSRKTKFIIIQSSVRRR